tara:strand:- start:812 stop:1261 length:450 start_codon:yes stop_codon:yes gene_type:complete
MTMQTFVPYASLKKTAESLDRARLGKQRSESKIILNVLEAKKSGRHLTKKMGWVNHPAVLMWEGHEDFLRVYSIAICLEWIKRGYKDSTLPFFMEGLDRSKAKNKPAWWGDQKVHLSHRSKLMSKMPEHYENIFEGVPQNLDYYWPVRS